MSLEDKVGQLFIGHFRGSEFSPELENMLLKHRFGGVILYSVLGNIPDMESVARLSSEMRRRCIQAGVPQPFIALDREGSYPPRAREGMTVFPTQMALGATRNPGLAAAMARAISTELQSMGVNVNFAPVADVQTEPKNPIIGTRSFGASPALVSELTTAMVEEYIKEQIICSPKHFPGHGSTAVDSHLSLPVAHQDKKTLLNVHVTPFAAAIRACAPMIMTAHVSYPALDSTGSAATYSKSILHDLLREELGFRGVVVSDSLTMAGAVVPGGPASIARQALDAGVDVLLFGASSDGSGFKAQLEAKQGLLQMVRSGEIPESRINAAVARILALKSRYGILDQTEKPTVQLSPQTKQAHLRLAHDIAGEAITVVDDESGLIPLISGEGLAVICTRNTRELATALKKQFSKCETLVVAEHVRNDEIKKAAALANRSLKTIVVVTRPNILSGQAQLLQALDGDKTIAVVAGNPFGLKKMKKTRLKIHCFGWDTVSLSSVALALRGGNTNRGILPVPVQQLFNRP